MTSFHFSVSVLVSFFFLPKLYRPYVINLFSVLTQLFFTAHSVGYEYYLVYLLIF